MLYLERNLGRGEEIISKCEVSMAAITINIVIGVLFIFLLGLLGIIVAAIIILPSFLKIKSTELGLTNKKILGKYGVINTKIMDSPLGKINSVTVEQGLDGKIFGYGKIVISTSSGGYKFNFIKNADSFRSAVMEQIDIAEEEKLRKQAEQLAGAMK